MCVSTMRKAFVLRTHISGNVVVFIWVFFQVLKVLLPFLISHTLHSANTQAFLLHLFPKASRSIFVSVVD